MWKDGRKRGEREGKEKREKGRGGEERKGAGECIQVLMVIEGPGKRIKFPTKFT